MKMLLTTAGLASILAALAFGCEGAGSLTTLDDDELDAAVARTDASPLSDATSLDLEAAAPPDARALDGGNEGKDAAPVITAFSGAPSFQAGKGTSARNGQHAFGGAAPTNPAKQACFGCHKDGGSGAKFLFAGTAFKDTNGTTPAPGVEIRVRAANGTARLVRTDDDGNFFLKPAAGDPAVPWKTGGRDATKTALMVAAVATLGDGNCNGCHKGGGGANTAFIHVP